jgi:hypothetical protein
MQRKEDLSHQLDEPAPNSPKWRKRLTIILLSVLLPIMSGLGVYWLGARQQQCSSTDLLTKPKHSQLPSTTPTQRHSVSPTITTSQAASIGRWRTYKNEQLGILFHYPSDWKIKPYLPKYKQEGLMHRALDLLAQNNEHGPYPGYQGYLGTLYYYDNPEHLPLQTLEQKRKQVEKSNLVPPLYSPDDELMTLSNATSIFYRKMRSANP